MNARVLITKKCFRGCEGCCNDNIDIQYAMESANIYDLLKYDEIVLTGGEPLQIKGLTTKVVEDLRMLGFEGKIILYTSLVTRELYDLIGKHLIQGITFTLHDKLYKNEIERLKYFSKRMDEVNHKTNMRFKIETSIAHKHTTLLKHIDKHWDSCEQIEWFEDGECPIIEDKLLVLEGLKC